MDKTELFNIGMERIKLRNNNLGMFRILRIYENFPDDVIDYFANIICENYKAGEISLEESWEYITIVGLLRTMTEEERKEYIGGYI